MSSRRATYCVSLAENPGSCCKYSGEKTYCFAFEAAVANTCRPDSAPDVIEHRVRVAVFPFMAATCHWRTVVEAPSCPQSTGIGAWNVNLAALGSASQ